MRAISLDAFAVRRLFTILLQPAQWRFSPLPDAEYLDHANPRTGITDTFLYECDQNL
jgi:hypothetical protein